jgi:hypothetical protein
MIASTTFALQPYRGSNRETTSIQAAISAFTRMHRADSRTQIARDATNALADGELPLRPFHPKGLPENEKGLQCGAHERRVTFESQPMFL